MPNLGGAGAERVISILLNHLDRKLFIPKLIILKKNGRNTFLSDLNSDVEIISLGLKSRLRFSVISFIIRLIRVIRRESPDILFMGAGTINAFVSPFLFLLSNRTKKIARESNLPSHFEKIRLIRWMYKKFYNNYDVIIAQSDDMVSELINNFDIIPSKIKKINNPVDVDYIRKKIMEDSQVLFPEDKINLLAAGRLTYQKGFDLLLNELSGVKNINYHLTILGEGEEETNLKNQMISLGMQDRVTFKGNVINPYIYMNKADVFILSSRFEGFPNVLLEALTCGCPVLANDCPGGIREIITEGFNGFIFNYELRNFSEKLCQTLESTLQIQSIVKDIENRFSVEIIKKNYEAILLD